MLRVTSYELQETSRIKIAGYEFEKGYRLQLASCALLKSLGNVGFTSLRVQVVFNPESTFELTSPIVALNDTRVRMIYSQCS